MPRRARSAAGCSSVGHRWRSPSCRRAWSASCCREARSCSTRCSRATGRCGGVCICWRAPCCSWRSQRRGSSSCRCATTSFSISSLSTSISPASSPMSITARGRGGTSFPFSWWDCFPGSRSSPGPHAACGPTRPPTATDFAGSASRWCGQHSFLSSSAYRAPSCRRIFCRCFRRWPLLSVGNSRPCVRRRWWA